ncbi:MAG: choline/ethanolamine kinase family protein [Pseudomonadota bacterium]
MSDAGARIEAISYWTSPVTWEPLKGGLSNESFTVTQGADKFVVRFGRDFPFHHVFRDREIMATRAAHAAGFAPELVYAEPGIMISRFIDAKTYDADDVKANIGRIAETVSGFHTSMARHVSGPGFMFWVFHVIRDYANTLCEGGSRMIDHLPDYLKLAEEMEAAQVPLPIIYGHHDFLPANFMDDGERLWVIDFEYAGFSTAMFDLAGTASNAEFDADQADELLTAYFGSPPDAAMKKSHAAMQCASLLREAMWSMVSELYLDAPGVDYEAYTQENLERLDTALDAYRSVYGRD